MKYMQAQTPFSPHDRRMMARALELAKQGEFTTAPNPNVGCVISLDGQIIGEGAHLRAGTPHAEVHALAMLKEKGLSAQSATAYVTLEPCSHFGRTPPCAKALIEAKVARVVCAMVDPNPEVSGRGIEMLRAAGIQVDVGLFEDKAHALNLGFIKKMKTGMPYVQLKLAMSLDGKTALANGESKWITASPARSDVQVYRAKAGAILSTSRTVLRDDASLNVRFDELPQTVKNQYNQPVRQPKRIILNRKQSINAQNSQSLKLMNTPGEVVFIENDLDLKQILKQVASDEQVNHIWVEAGRTLATNLLELDLVDELIIYIAPKLMGDDAQGLTAITGLTSMSELTCFSLADVAQVGEDVRLTMKRIN